MYLGDRAAVKIPRVGYLVEAEGAVEHAAGLDGAVEHVGEQLREHRGQADRAVADHGHGGTRGDPAVNALWWPVQNTSVNISREGSSAASSSIGSLTRVPWAWGTRTASP